MYRIQIKQKKKCMISHKIFLNLIKNYIKTFYSIKKENLKISCLTIYLRDMYVKKINISFFYYMYQLSQTNTKKEYK